MEQTTDSSRAGDASQSAPVLVPGAYIWGREFPNAGSNPEPDSNPLCLVILYFLSEGFSRKQHFLLQGYHFYISIYARSERDPSDGSLSVTFRIFSFPPSIG
jgi:hypothetical protein